MTKNKDKEDKSGILFLENQIIGCEIHNLDIVDSTNNYAAKLAKKGCREGTTVIAKEQTKGKGRLGREWQSIYGKGIYMSIVIRPNVGMERIKLSALMTACAVRQALYETMGAECGIKWPNDLLLNGRKVCGILLEMNTESDILNYLIVGIGINVTQETKDFGDNLGKATSLKLEISENIRNRNMNNGGISNKGDTIGNNMIVSLKTDIILSVLKKMEQAYKDFLGNNLQFIFDTYRKYSVTYGRQICFSENGVVSCGKAFDITGTGNLVVKMEDGDIKEVGSGEVGLIGEI